MFNVIEPITSLECLQINFSNACNHRCVFCYQDNYTTRLDPVVYHKKLLSIYPVINELMLQGGEPTINQDVRDLIPVVIEKNNKIKFSMITNGHEFGVFWQDIFAERGAWVHFSVNAATAETYEAVTPGGNWTALINNITGMIEKKKLLNPAMPVIASFVAVDENAHEIYQFIKMCKDIGITTPLVFFDPARFPENKTLVLLEIEKSMSIMDGFITGNCEGSPMDALISTKMFAGGHPMTNDRAKPATICCEPAFNRITIEPDGCVRFCCFLPQYLGNINGHETLEELWNNDVAKKIRQDLLNKKFIEIGCNIARCPYFA